ncbi:MAG: hypothetical protein L0Y71_09480 [Gemmataceae bacterium]|nr:hypothetical protein [Gemmataceae bacterium]
MNFVLQSLGDKSSRSVVSQQDRVRIHLHEPKRFKFAGIEQKGLSQLNELGVCFRKLGHVFAFDAAAA